MLYLVLALFALAVVCFVRPHLGMLIVVAAGFLQDPLRKLVPGEPVALVLVSLGLYGAVVAGLAAAGAFRQVIASRFGGSFQGPVALFLVLVALQSLHLFVRTGSVVLPALGFVSYAAPIVAGAVGFILGLRRDRLLRFLRVYSWWGLGAAATVLVSRYFPDAAIFRSVGKGLTVYGEDLQVRLSSGILRTPEVAAWHAATTGCVLLILLSLGKLERRRRNSLLLGAAGLVIVVLAVIWTGRRKALVEIVLFAIVFAVLSMGLKGGNRRLLAVLVLGGALLSYQLIEGRWAAGTSREAAYLIQRGGTTTSEGTTRLGGALSSVTSALRSYGILGVGAGAAAQGSQHFAGAGSVRWEAEFGIGRIVAELGLAGLVLVTWLVTALAGALRRRLRSVMREDPETSRLALGLVALLAANAAVFITAAQVFGDPFVYLTLGTLAGSLAGLLEAKRSRALVRPTEDFGVAPEPVPAGLR